MCPVRSVRVMRRSAAWITLWAWLAIVCSGCAAVTSVSAASPSTAGTARYVDSQGWSLRYPGSLLLERSPSGPGMATFTEVTVANFVQRRAVLTGRTRDGGFIRIRPPLDRSGRFPANGVAFRMLMVAGGPGPVDTVADSRFPISVATFRQPQQRSFPASDYTRLGVPSERSRPIQADGQQYTGELFFGRSATPRERAEIEAVVRSLVFPKLRPGERVGDEQVLGLARDYPVGSFTLIHAVGEVCNGPLSTCDSGHAPFYLVHAPGRLDQPDLLQPCTPVISACASPGAFYAIGWKWEDRAGGYRSACDLRLDKIHDEFYCTNSTAGWDRVGRVIHPPAGTRSVDPLQFAFAKVTWDGHVVFVPGLDENPPQDAARSMLWPGMQWH